jgi:cytokinin riboside 5'-monophosphate phosphoribohydrolase
MTIKKICVYCSSSEAVENKYFDFTKKLAELLVKNRYDLVYGGANVGLMNSLAITVKQNGGKVFGVMPELIFQKGLAFTDCDDFFVTNDMASRKAKMAELADAFIALPGGFGTLEELLEIITLKQLNYHQKPIVIINFQNFYDDLLLQFEKFYNSKFSKEVSRNIYFVSENFDEIFSYLKNHKQQTIDSKWFDVSKKEFEK